MKQRNPLNEKQRGKRHMFVQTCEYAMFKKNNYRK